MNQVGVPKPPGPPTANIGKRKVRRPKAIGSGSMQANRASMEIQKPKMLTGVNTKLPTPPKLLAPKAPKVKQNKPPGQKPPKPIGGKR